MDYGPCPPGLRDKYLGCTDADLRDLRAVCYAAPFSDVQTGVGRYVGWLLQNR